jgi:outer membrane protein assembly factor BamB
MKLTLIALLALGVCLPLAGADKKKSGTALWEFETGGKVFSSPAIGSDGTVYVGSMDNKLYAIKTDSKGLAKSPWPMRGQNARHTGRVMKK